MEINEIKRGEMPAVARRNLERLTELTNRSPLSPECAYVVSAENVRRAVVTSFFLILEKIPTKQWRRMKADDLHKRIQNSDLSHNAKSMVATFTTAWVARGGIAQDHRKPAQAHYYETVKYNDVHTLKMLLDDAAADRVKKLFSQVPT